MDAIEEAIERNRESLDEHKKWLDGVSDKIKKTQFFLESYDVKKNFMIEIDDFDNYEDVSIGWGKFENKFRLLAVYRLQGDNVVRCLNQTKFGFRVHAVQFLPAIIDGVVSRINALTEVTYSLKENQ